MNQNKKLTIIILFVVVICYVGISFYTSYQKSKIDAYLIKNDIVNKLFAETKAFQISKKEVPKYFLATYKEVSFNLPENWNYKPQEIEKATTYQITCWDKVGINSFAISWIENEVDVEDYLDFMKESLKKVATHKECVFEPNSNGDFRNNETVTCEYSGKILDNIYNGKLIAFKNNGKTYLIIFQGDSAYNKNGTPEKIISSLKIGYLKNTPKNNDQSELLSDWMVYEIEKIGTIAIPPSMEIRDENSYIALIADVVKDKISVVKKIALKKPSLIFQPRGTNERIKDATLKYSRILISYQNGESGDFYKRNEQFSLSEKVELNSTARQDVISSFDGFGIKLVQWYPFEIITINNISWHKISYIRQMGDNPSVYVEDYQLYNDNQATEITLSYRTTEKSLWENDFKRVIDTYKPTN